MSLVPTERATRGLCNHVRKNVKNAHRSVYDVSLEVQVLVFVTSCLSFSFYHGPLPLPGGDSRVFHQ